MQYSLVAVNIDSIIGSGAEAVTQYKSYDVDHAEVQMGNLVGGYITLDNDTKWWVRLPQIAGFVVKRVTPKDEGEADPVLKEWGPFDSIPDYSTEDVRLFRWFTTYLYAHYAESDTDPDCFPNSVFKWQRRLTAFQPIRSKLKYGSMSIYKSLDMRIDDRHTVMKPGRAISTMFPELEHKQVILLVDDFLKEFVPRTLTISVAKDRAAFKLAYGGTQSPMENISTTHNRKSSSSSCMRYDFDHLDCHPAEAYASGDFIVVMALDQKGLVAGRCVVYTGDDCIGPQAGPIYGVSEQALDMIEDHLGGMDAETDNPHWGAAKLLAIPASDEGDGRYIAPYLDTEPRMLEVTSDGKYLVQDVCGSIDASNYSGVLGGHENHCTHCGAGLDEHESMWSEYCEEDFCEDCWHNEHFYCEYSEESYHNDQAVRAYKLDSSGTKQSLVVSEWAVNHGDSFVICVDDEYWHIDDAQYCEGDDEWISPEDIGDYFTSDWDGELHLVVAMCTLVEGETVSRQELNDDDGTWELNDDCLWENKQEEMDI